MGGMGGDRGKGCQDLSFPLLDSCGAQEHQALSHQAQVIKRHPCVDCEHSLVLAKQQECVSGGAHSAAIERQWKNVLTLGTHGLQ